MAEDLSFVTTLGTKDEFIPLSEIHPGTHTDCILKESIRPVKYYANIPDRIPQDAFILATSFPDILPRSGRLLLSHAIGIFVRGEFLALRVIGNKKTKLPLTGNDRKRLRQIIASVAKAAPDIIYYRLMDYNPDEFTFLDTPITDNIRGSARLLLDKDLLEHELAVISQFEKLGKKVRIILPLVISPQEQDKIQQLMRAELPDQIGTMPETIEHVKNILTYPAVDFLFPGPSDLTADLRKIKRGEYRDSHEKEEIISLVKSLTAAAYKQLPPDLLMIKILVDQIPTSAQQQVYNVYMPNQLISAKNK